LLISATVKVKLTAATDHKDTMMPKESKPPPACSRACWISGRKNAA
jgi:hypothetical protein